MKFNIKLWHMCEWEPVCVVCVCVYVCACMLAMCMCIFYRETNHYLAKLSKFAAFLTHTLIPIWLHWSLPMQEPFAVCFLFLLLKPTERSLKFMEERFNIVLNMGTETQSLENRISSTEYFRRIFMLHSYQGCWFIE